MDLHGPKYVELMWNHITTRVQPVRSIRNSYVPMHGITNLQHYKLKQSFGICFHCQFQSINCGTSLLTTRGTGQIRPRKKQPSLNAGSLQYPLSLYIYVCMYVCMCIYIYTGCPRRNGQNFRRVFLMLNYTDITQNTYIQIWTVTEIMAIEKCGLLGCPRTVRRPWRHPRPVRMPGNQTPLASNVMQWPWRDNASAAACVNHLGT